MSQKAAKELRRQLRRLREFERAGVSMGVFKRVYNGIHLEKFTLAEKVRATRVVMRDER